MLKAEEPGVFPSTRGWFLALCLDLLCVFFVVVAFFVGTAVCPACQSTSVVFTTTSKAAYGCYLYAAHY